MDECSYDLSHTCDHAIHLDTVNTEETKLTIGEHLYSKGKLLDMVRKSVHFEPLLGSSPCTVE